MKKIVILMVGIFMSVIAPIKAETTEGGVTVAGINLSTLFADARAGVGIPIKGGDIALSLYRPVLYLHTEDAELVNLGVGATMLPNGTKLSVYPGFRIDTLLAEIPGLSSWTKKHITVDMPTTLQISAGPLWTEGREFKNPEWYCFIFWAFK